MIKTTKKSNIFSVAFFVLVMLLNGCAQQFDDTSPAGICIGTFHTYAYKTPKGYPEKTPPLGDWTIEALLPESSFSNSKLFDVEIARPIDKQTEIWVNIPDTNVYFTSQADYYDFLVYNIELRNWKTISAQVSNTKAFVGKLFLAKDGTLWGQNFWEIQRDPDNISETNTYPVLSRFNEGSQKFEFVINTQDIPAYWIASDRFPFWDRIMIDRDGLFWIFVHKDGIYSFDPISYKTQKHTEIPNYLIQQAVPSPNSGIYFRVINEDKIAFSLQKGELFLFSPSTGSIKILGVPPGNWPTFSNMLVDSSGNLWLDTVGWRSQDGTWQKIYPNTILYYWKMQVEADYSWHTPSITLESSDGRLWFRKENGMAWLDPRTMEGCWFTTFNSNVVEDKLYNLWMVADGKLYKNPIQP